LECPYFIIVFTFFYRPNDEPTSAADEHRISQKRFPASGSVFPLAILEDVNMVIYCNFN